MDLLDNDRALATTLARHPTVINCASPLSGESVLQFTVRKKSAQRVEALARDARSLSFSASIVVI